MTDRNGRLALVNLDEITAMLQHPTAALRMTEPQSVPANVWTTLMWGEILFDPRSDCDPQPPHAFICPATALYRASTVLWLPDIHSAVVSLGTRVADREPVSVFDQVLCGQSAEDREDGLPAPMVSVPYVALFRAREGEQVRLAVRHGAGAEVLCDDVGGIVPHLLIEYVGPDPERVAA